MSCSDEGRRSPASPGDTLNYSGPPNATKTLSGPGAGTISDTDGTPPNYQDVVYTWIETLTTTPGSLLDDVITLPADTSPNLVTVKLDASALGA